MQRFVPQIEGERLEQEILRAASRSVIDIVQAVTEHIPELRELAHTVLGRSVSSSATQLVQELAQFTAENVSGPLFRSLLGKLANLSLELGHVVSLAQSANASRHPSRADGESEFSDATYDTLALALDAPDPVRELGAVCDRAAAGERLNIARALASRTFWAKATNTPERRQKLHAGVRPRLIGLGIAEAMKDAAHAENLCRYADDWPERLQLEAGRMIRSLKMLRDLDRPVRVGFVFAMYAEQPNLQPGRKSNDLAVTLDQLLRLKAVSPGLEWNLIGVCDGDDRDPSDPHRVITSAEAARAYLNTDFPDLLGDTVHILQIDQATKQRHLSVKGGAVLFGAHYAIDRLHADIVVFNDLLPEFSYYVVGEAIDRLLEGAADAVICSRWHPDSAAHRPYQRWLMSTVYTSIRSLLLPEIAEVFDTQAAMKCFRSDALRNVLPIKSEQEWDEEFDYALSFDSLLLAKLKQSGRRIVEVPTVLMGIDPGGATVFAEEMAKALCKQRHLLDEQLAREQRAVHAVAGGFDLHVLSRGDLPFVIKTPKFESGMGRSVLRFAESALERSSSRHGSKESLTHELLASDAAVDFRDRLGELPPMVLSKIFSLMRLYFSPYPSDLTGYEIARNRAGGIVPPFCMMTNLAVRLIKDKRTVTRVFPRAIVQERVDVNRTVAKLLRREGVTDEDARELLRATLDLQRKLWRRGVYNLDVTYYLADTVVDDSRGKTWYVDPGDFTDCLDDAVRSVERELAAGIESRVDVQRLRKESPAWADIYLQELLACFNPQTLRDQWNREGPIPVTPPDTPGLDELCTAFDDVECIRQLYNLLLDGLVDRSSPWVGANS